MARLLIVYAVIFVTVILVCLTKVLLSLHKLRSNKVGLPWPKNRDAQAVAKSTIKDTQKMLLDISPHIIIGTIGYAIAWFPQ